MNKGVYVATIEPNSGKSIVVLGMMRMLLGEVAKVGYFRPIIDDFIDDRIDNHIDTVSRYFSIGLAYEEMYAYTRSEVLAAINTAGLGAVLDVIIEKYKRLEETYDFVLVEGTDFSDEGNIKEFDINIEIAKNLGIPALILANASNSSVAETLANLKLAHTTFDTKEVRVLAVVANKVPRNLYEEATVQFQTQFKGATKSILIPAIPTLMAPTLLEIVKQLDGKVLFGKELLNNQALHYGVGAMQLRNYLLHLKENSLVITPGDRADIILGALQANLSENYPKVSGIILTGGIIPEDTILKLIEGLSTTVPIVSVATGTFETTNRVGAVRPRVYGDNTAKIEQSIAVFERYVKVQDLLDQLITFRSDTMTPRMFQYKLVQMARKHKKHIVLPEGEDERILRAASRLIEQDIVFVTLLGDEERIRQKASETDIQVNFDKIQIIDPVHSASYESYVQTLYELRKHKKVNKDMARDFMADVSYFGTMMVYQGDADGMVSGAVHTTQHTIRPALQFIKTKPGIKVVSSIFFMCLEDRVSVFGDCAINPNPNAEQLAEIAISSAASAQNFGIDPKIAMLSYSSGSSGQGVDVDVVREATEIVRSRHPELKVEGPIQYDAAVDATVGKKKLPDSEVAGRANVLIFPDLNTGNNTYKAVQRETGALAIGPMLQGLNKPVNDLSRGCTVDDVYNTVIITAIQAQ